MNRQYPTEALEFAAAVRGALGRLGGVDLARRAEVDPGLRAAVLRPALAELGFLDLAPLNGEVELMAAALGISEAGAVVCPWPLVQALSVPGELSGRHDGMFVGSPEASWLPHLDQFTAAVLVSADGVMVRVEASAEGPRPAPLDPFGVSCRVLQGDGMAGGDSLSLYFVLDAFYILGGLKSVMAMTAEYAGRRRQFGRPIGSFGAVRWRISDMAVATAGLEELAAFTLWRHATGEIDASDALALRLVAIESAQLVLHQGHQVFAAIGLCDEHDLSVIDRHLQSALRRPFGLAEATRRFSAALNESGFSALFPITASGAVAAEH